MTDQYAVFGNPVAHSRSPQIHAAFAQQTQQPLDYTRQQVEPGNFVAAADEFFAQGGKGLNITVPFKLEAYEYAVRLTPRARRAGAVNTLALQDDGTILGDNTDGVGMVGDILNNHGWSIAGQRVLVLGAGGAVRGVLEPLLAQGPQRLVIANRTLAKALQLVRGFKGLVQPGGKLQACGYEDLTGLQFDLVINGTSASLAGDLPPLPAGLLAQGAACYDMMYAAQPTVFLQWAEAEAAAQRADGLGMLVCQAAESFNLWRGQQPQTAALIGQLRDEL